jgi:excisionase family DNA binding protein
MSNAIMEPPALTVRQVAELLQVTVSAVRGFIHSGVIEAVKLDPTATASEWRIPRAALDPWLGPWRPPVAINEPVPTQTPSEGGRAAAEGGLRRSEICGLRWPDVDLKARRLHIRRGYDGPTKGRRSRTISVSPDFVALLDAWFAESVVGQGAAAEGYVWPGTNGGMMHEHTPTQTCNRALIRAGLVDAEGKPMVTLHGLRHTCASLMLLDGRPLLKVSRYLGHADVNITARVYAHLTDDSELDAGVDTFQAIFIATHDTSVNL